MSLHFIHNMATHLGIVTYIAILTTLRVMRVGIAYTLGLPEGRLGESIFSYNSFCLFVLQIAQSKSCKVAFELLEIGAVVPTDPKAKGGWRSCPLQDSDDPVECGRIRLQR
jgi:hypothetical protein